MFRETSTYKEARQAGNKAVIFAFLTSNRTRRVFGKEYITSDLSGTTGGNQIWNGDYTVGDGNIWSPLPVSDTLENVVSWGSLRQTIAPQSKDLLSSFAMTEIPSFSFVLRNVDGYFTDATSLQSGENFIFQNVKLYQAFKGNSFEDTQKLFDGEVSATPFSNNDFKVLVQGVSEGLRKILVLPKAGQYANPGNESDILPYVVGDMTENSPGACWKCPLIDSGNDVYAIACHAILTAANGNTFTVYDNDGEINSGEYTVTASGDYESQGTIAYLTFSTPPNGDVFITCKGAVDASGALVTNPIDVIEDLLEYAEDNIDGFSYTLNATAFNTAKIAATAASYTCSGAIIADNQIAFHLTHILSSFLGDWWIDNRGELSVRLDAQTTNYNIVADLVERNVKTKVLVNRTSQNYVNQILANYAITFKKSDLRFKTNTQSGYYEVDDGESTKDSTSQARSGVGQRIREYNFDWTRNTATVNSLQTRLVSRFADGVNVLTWAEKDLLNINVEVGDIVTYSTDTLKDENGLVLRNQLGQVISKEIDLDTLFLTFEIRDLGLYRPADPDLWNGVKSLGDGATWGGERDRRILA